MSQFSVTRSTTRSGFTLVMTLSILAAVTILVVGLFSIVARERKTSTSFNAVEQADLAVQAGLEQAGMLLKEALRDENGLIVSVPTAPWITQEEVESDPKKILQSEEGRSEGATLMAMCRKLESSDFGGWAWTYTPLVSGVFGSEVVSIGGVKEVDPVLNGLRSKARPILPGAFINGVPNFELVSRSNASDRRKTDGQKAEDLLALKRGVQKAVSEVAPWMRTPQQNWVEIALRDPGNGAENGGEEVAARFSFHIEDLQGSLPLSTAGNIEAISGLHERTAFAFPPLMPSGLVDREKELLRWSATLVPGMNLRRPQFPLLAETSLHTFFQPNVEPFAGNAVLDDVLNQMHRVMLRNRFMQVSPESWKEALLQPDTALGWPGLDEGSVHTRDAVSGSLTNPVVRRIEEQTAPGLIPYDELALIPSDTAFSNLNRYRNPAAPTNFIEGPARKLNLNLWLRGIEAEPDMERRQEKVRGAVDYIASRIQDHLPFFAGSDAGTSNPDRMGRKGGYPLPLGGSNQQKARAYLQCLAAGIIDYADTDGVPTMDGDPTLKPEDDNGSNDKANQWADHYPRYRGMDSFPIVTEQWQRYRREPNSTPSLVRFSVTHYVELWNMTNFEISGEIVAAYEANGVVPVAGFSPTPVDLMKVLDGETPNASIEGVGKPQKNSIPDLRRRSSKLGDWWHTPVVLAPMRPNEVRVIAFPPVVYNINPGNTAGGASASISFQGKDTEQHDLRSRYRIAIKPPGASGFVIVDQPLRPVDRLSRQATVSNPQSFNLTLPGMSYARTVGGPRIFYNNVGDPRGAFFINYFQDYPNYEEGSSPWTQNVRYKDKDSFFGLNRIHLWPDGGHISPSFEKTKRQITNLNVNPDQPPLPVWHASRAPNVIERQKYVQHLSNAGRFFSVTELGHVFDPIMWDPDGGEEHSVDLSSLYGNLANLRGTNVKPSDKYCGGNTLRIGRVEHDRFRPDFNIPAAAGRPNTRSLCATSLLDLFHCGQPRAGWHTVEMTADETKQLTGDLIHIHGHVNLNTASRDTLRAMAAGRLVMDPRLSRTLPVKRPGDADHEITIGNNVPKLNESMLYPPSSAENGAQADLLAELIIRHRPYITPAELPERVVMPTSAELQRRAFPSDLVVQTKQPGVVIEEGRPVLGASRRPTDRTIEPEWNDAAAEEAFARIFNNSTVRSRNFKVVVTGQSVRRTRGGETVVLATRSRLYHVFIRPIRDENDNIVRQQTEIIYARTL